MSQLLGSSSENGVGKRATSQYQNWCFTGFKSTDGSALDLLSDFRSNPVVWPATVAKAQFQLERCPDTNRVHAQGVLRLHKRTVFSTVKALLQPLFPDCHLEECKGSWQENLDYCSKAEGRIDGPFRHNVCDPAAPFDRIVEYRFGVPCNGKSTEARADLRAKGFEVYEVTKADASAGTWLSNYHGEEGVILDEVDESWFSEGMWKKLLDRLVQRMPAGSGGKSVDWVARHIIMISNFLPPRLFRTEPFKTRIHRIVHVSRPPYKLPETALNYNEGDNDFMAEFTRPQKRAKLSASQQ